MQFDDRLATVLRQRADAQGGARTQYRQLLDLLGRPQPDRDPSLLAAARVRLDALADVISVRERAEIIREQGRSLNDPDLVAHFADAEPDIASAALSCARLREDEWLSLIPELPVRARGFLRLRRDLPRQIEALLQRLGIRDRALPLPSEPEPTVEETAAKAEEKGRVVGRNRDAAIVEAEFSEVGDAGQEVVSGNAADQGEAELSKPAPSITEHFAAIRTEARTGEAARPAGETAALRQRIEAFQRARDERTRRLGRDALSGAALGDGVADPETDGAAPTLPFTDGARQPLTGFGFTTDSSGAIDWADSFAAARVLYLALPTILPAEQRDAIERQQPLRGVRVTMEGGPAIAGEWILDATPRFASRDGRFLGFAGGMRRTLDDRKPDDRNDRLRQLLHELRTPVNAVQGFAEVIQQQVFGQVPHDYRALAAGIAGDSARMLAGFEDLERLSQLENGQLDPDGGDTDLAAIFRQHLSQLQPLLQPRNAGFVATLDGACRIDLAKAEAERLSWRILATLGASTAPGEKLALTMEEGDAKGTAKFVADLPASLAGSDDVFAARGKPQSVAISAGPFGPGFALRLARAEARAIGGDLRCENRQLILTLPALTTDRRGATAGDSQTRDVPEHAL